MEHFYGGGGRSNPDFVHRFLVKSIPNEMYKWLEDYPLTGPFERWYIQHNGKPTKSNADSVQVPMIQIESRKAAYMFKIAYSEYIIEDLTYDFAKGEGW
jgi:hypothetical protein